MSRADRQTETSIQEEYFSDFSIDFARNPITGNLARLTNTDAVKQSIKLLILTLLGEWPHDNYLGAQVNKMLFEPADDVTTSGIKLTITEVINNHEPRATVRQVVVNNDDANNSYNVTVLFSLKNTTSVTSLSIILKRAR